MENTVVYAIDFDGVICDSAVETGVAGWKAAVQLWDDMPSTNLPPGEIIDQFRKLRPAMETGYEAVIFMRMLYEGTGVDSLLTNFSELKQRFLIRYKLEPNDLKETFAKVRDDWINSDEQEWISMNPLFPTVAEKLRMLERQYSWYIVTTKQERFVKQILDANQIHIAEDRIFGLDRNVSKEEVLADLLKVHQNQKLIFIEDRLPTLMNVVNNPNLQSVKLLLVSWGYNTEQDRQGLEDGSIKLINMEDFLADLSRN
ncbi:MAG: HAD family hydrolase [Methylococcales bacterium]